MPQVVASVHTSDRTEHPFSMDIWHRAGPTCGAALWLSLPVLANQSPALWPRRISESVAARTAPLPMSQLCRVCSYYTWLLPVEDNTVILTFSWVRSDCLSIDPVHWL